MERVAKIRLRNRKGKRKWRERFLWVQSSLRDQKEERETEAVEKRRTLWTLHLLAP
jgi:hypothetical protein